MISKYNQQIVTALIISIMFTCSGCWDRRELDSLAIVAGIALDQVPSTNQVQVTVQIFNISKMSSGQQGGGEKGGESGSFIVSSQGTTVYQALLKCTYQTSRQLFFPHDQVLLISESLARKGISNYIDFFLRSHEIRDTAWVMVTKGKAADVLNTKPMLEQVSSMDMSKMVLTRAETSMSSGVNLYELAKRISSKASAPLTSYIKKTNDKQQERLFLAGTTVFNRNLQMVGTLSERETRGLLWAINKAQRGVLVVKTPVSNGYTSVNVLRSKGQITPEISHGQLHIKVKIHCLSVVKDTTGYLDMNSPAVWDSLQRREGTVIYNDVMMALDKSRQLNVDIFGFGDEVYKRYPNQWKQMQSNWQDIFNNVDVQVSVNVEQRRSGLLRNPVRAE